MNKSRNFLDQLGQLEIRSILIVTFCLLLSLISYLFSPAAALASTINISSNANSNLSASSTSGSGIGGLVGWWTFDGKNMVSNVADSSGNNNTGTLTGMNRATAIVPGKLGQGLKFNGNNQYVNIGSSPTVTGPITISAWMYLTKSSYTGNTTVMTGPINLVIQGSLLLAYGTIGGVTSNFGNNTNGVNITTLGNRWIHYVFTYDGSTAGAYINGVHSGTRDSANGAISSPYAWNFGYNSSFPSAKSWNGSIDDVRIYNRALSAQEVMQLYDMGR